MTYQRYLQVFLALCATAFGAGSYADTLQMKNGDRITGTLVGIAGGKVTFSTEYAGELVVAQDAVADVSAEKPFQVVDSSGAISELELDATTDIGSIRTAKESFVAGVAFAAEWTNRLDLASSISTGNSETAAHSALLESNYKAGRAQHKVNVAVFIEEADDVTTKDQLDIDYNFKWFYADAWYAAANAEYFQDDLTGVDQRITVGAGVGHQFWDDTYGSLSAEAGISQVFEEALGADESDPALRWALDYKKFLIGKRLELFHNHQILAIQDRGEVIDASTGLRYSVSDRLSVSGRADVQHDTEPPLGSEKTDVTYLIGVGLTF